MLVVCFTFQEWRPKHAHTYAGRMVDAENALLDRLGYDLAIEDMEALRGEDVEVVLSELSTPITRMSLAEALSCLTPQADEEAAAPAPQPVIFYVDIWPWVRRTGGLDDPGKRYNKGDVVLSEQHGYPGEMLLSGIHRANTAAALTCRLALCLRDVDRSKGVIVVPIPHTADALQRECIVDSLRRVGVTRLPYVAAWLSGNPAARLDPVSFSGAYDTTYRAIFLSAEELAEKLSGQSP